MKKKITMVIAVVLLLFAAAAVVFTVREKVENKEAAKDRVVGIDVEFIGAENMQEHDLITFYNEENEETIIFGAVYSDEADPAIRVYESDFEGCSIYSPALDLEVKAPSEVKKSKYSVIVNYGERTIACN